LIAFALGLLGKPAALHAQIGSTADPICRLPVFYDSMQSTNGRPEYDVKAAILYRCLELVQWPAQSLGSKSSPLRIGILGENQFGPSLKFLKGKKVAGRKLVVTELSSLSQARKCQLVFISRSETNRTDGILNELASAPVLTVGEVPGFTGEGGIINLLVVDTPAIAPLAAGSPAGPGTESRTKTIRFEVNAAAAEKAGIVLHPALIKLGTHTPEPSPAQTAPASPPAPRS
jgi:hypothetical protein